MYKVQSLIDIYIRQKKFAQTVAIPSVILMFPPSDPNSGLMRPRGVIYLVCVSKRTSEVITLTCYQPNLLRLIFSRRIYLQFLQLVLT